MSKHKKFIDLSHGKKQETASVLQSSLKNTSTLFSKGKRTEAFFTEDSRLYITPFEQMLLRKGIELNRGDHRWDNLSSRVVRRFVRYQPSEASLLLKALQERYEMFNDVTADASRNFLGQFSVAKLWNASIVASILFGMVMMTFVYKYLGTDAMAKQVDVASVTTTQQSINPASLVSVVDTDADAESFAKQVEQIEQARSTKSLEGEITKMVKGYPIEKMVPYIAKQDRTVAAFIVAIGKKESSWGQHVPVLNGQDCYNYWGYRGQRELMGTGGHTCFNSPEDAVNTVAKRIATLVEEKGKDTPQKMVLWKCGNSCAATGGQAAANKWIKDVDSVFSEFNING